MIFTPFKDSLEQPPLNYHAYPEPVELPRVAVTVGQRDNPRTVAWGLAKIRPCPNDESLNLFGYPRTTHNK